MTHPDPVELEFSFPVDVDGLPVSGRTYSIAAGPDESEKVAARLGLISLPLLKAEINLVPSGRDMVRVTGTVEADVVQQCVVSLAPVEAHLHETFDRMFQRALDPRHQTDDLPLDDDIPDLIEGGKIDIGEVVVEHLALVIDPYPRAPGAIFEAGGAGEEAKNQPDSPFAVLAKLKSSTKNN
ncbi:MAG: DUF177 domain-containing protein [Rhodobacteraceae bacterium]|nr:DUF177 domain-containing protein [Paracoccaceae bacterium]